MYALEKKQKLVSKANCTLLNCPLFQRFMPSFFAFQALNGIAESCSALRLYAFFFVPIFATGSKIHN